MNRTLEIESPPGPFNLPSNPHPGSLAGTILRSLLIVIGIPGNTWTLYKVLKGHMKHRCSSSFVKFKLNLAISDNAVLLFYGISMTIWRRTFQWYAGPQLCKLVQCLNAFCFYLSSNIILCIAVERWLKLTHTTGHTGQRSRILLHRTSSFAATTNAWIGRMQGNRARTMLLLAWSAAFMSALPQVFVWDVYTLSRFEPTSNSTHRIQQCTTVWRGNAAKRCLPTQGQLIDHEQFTNCYAQRHPLELTYAYAHLLVIFWLPCAVILFANIRIILLLYGRTLARKRYIRVSHYNSQLRHRASLSHPSPVGRPHSSFAQIAIDYDPLFDWRLAIRTSVLRKTLLLSAAYVACWLPYNCLLLIEAFFASPPTYDFIMDLMADMMILNSVINPVLYRSHHYKRNAALSSSSGGDRLKSKHEVTLRLTTTNG